MADCHHCGLTAESGHDCLESKPTPSLKARLLNDHRDTIECEHGFSSFRDRCPNVICLGRDLGEAAARIAQAEGIVRDLLAELANPSATQREVVLRARALLAADQSPPA